MATWSAQPSLRIAAGAGDEFVPEFWAPDILLRAISRIRIFPMLGRLEKYGAQKGDIFRIQTIGTFGTQGTTLNAGTKVPITNLPIYQIIGTIQEYGNGVTINERLLRLAPYEIEGQMVRQRLAEDYAKAFETASIAELNTATTNLLNGGTYTSVTSHSILGTYANGMLSLGALRRANRVVETANISGFGNDGEVIGFFHPLQIEDLLSETASGGFQDVMKYQQLGIQKISDFEIGRVGKVRIVPSNFLTGTLEQASTGTVQTVTGLIFGQNAALWAWAMDPIFRYDNDYEKDFQRVQAIAWLSEATPRILIHENIIRLKTTVSTTI